MKKMKNYQKWFWIAAAFLICGSIHLLFDWIKYNNTLNSAPFSLWIVVNAVFFGSAALICLIVGWILQKKSKNRKDDTQ